MATLCLINEDGEVAGKWEIGGKALTVGRGQAADVKVNDEGLSRRHFMITRQNEDYVLKDLSSRNGTWVEGNRAVVAPLRHNDAIVAGRSEFRFREDSVFPGVVFPPRTGPHDTVIIPFALLPCESEP